MQPINTYNSAYSVQPVANVKSPYNTTYSANVVPINNQSSFVDETFNTYRRNNNLIPDYMKKVYSPSLGPSGGSTTESFIKAKSTYSPNFQHNEKATRYQMISEINQKLYKMQKNIDLYI